MTIQKFKLFSTNYSAVDYESATAEIIKYAENRESYGVSAMAVHGLVTSVLNLNLKSVINKIQMIVPDGQPVRWALNSFYKIGLSDRVYGPLLTLHVLHAANEKRLGIYLYGSTNNTLDNLKEFIKKNYPNVSICGIHVDRFREATPEEDKQDIAKINNSGAHIVLVGRGCPLQEFWVANHIGKVQAVMMAVGAAFDFYAGTLKQAPKWIQDHGLEWFYRLLMEPRRLWKRYLIANSYFIYLFIKHKLILRRPNL